MKIQKNGHIIRIQLDQNAIDVMNKKHPDCNFFYREGQWFRTVGLLASDIFNREFAEHKLDIVLPALLYWYNFPDTEVDLQYDALASETLLVIIDKVADELVKRAKTVNGVTFLSPKHDIYLSSIEISLLLIGIDDKNFINKMTDVNGSAIMKVGLSTSCYAHFELAEQARSDKYAS